MSNPSLSRPTVDDVNKAEKKFDDENGSIEWLLTQLFEKFPDNTGPNEVLLKTKVLNLLYETRILAVNAVAQHITSLVNIDSCLTAGSPDAVDLIVSVKLGDKVRNNFSFATKYCNWHNPAAYAIYDGNVDACLWCYKKQDSFTTFARQDLRYSGYPVFLRIVTAFRDFYGLNSFSFKQLDKFLWEKGPEA
ncbi:MAG: hypothetical protein ABSD98_18535, partial [Candidatus Korobacteraceae bacterium]